METDRRIIPVGKYQLDIDRQVLRGAGGEAELSPLAVRLLRFLAGKPDIIVSRGELIDELWAGNFPVGDPGLNRLISETRKSAQQVGAAPLIETIQKRGYRLIGAQPDSTPADAADAAPATASPLRRWIILTALILLVVVALNWLIDSVIGLIWVLRGGQ